MPEVTATPLLPRFLRGLAALGIRGHLCWTSREAMMREQRAGQSGSGLHSQRVSIWAPALCLLFSPLPTL